MAAIGGGAKLKHTVTVSQAVGWAVVVPLAHSSCAAPQQASSCRRCVWVWMQVDHSGVKGAGHVSGAVAASTSSGGGGGSGAAGGSSQYGPPWNKKPPPGLGMMEEMNWKKRQKAAKKAYEAGGGVAPPSAPAPAAVVRRAVHSPTFMTGIGFELHAACVVDSGY
eukprot:COSAG01_NODE_38_length_33931_cov_75.163632_20_plen_165_part_00